MFSQDLILHGNYRYQKDIVECFRFDAHIELLDSKGQTADQLFHGTKHNIEAGLDEACVLSPSFNDTDFGSRNGKTTEAHGVDTCARGRLYSTIEKDTAMKGRSQPT